MKPNMKIAVIGAGAMGSIYGANLSKNNEVYLIDTNLKIVEAINQNGLKIRENENDTIYYPKAVVDCGDIGVVDLVIVFVKALYTEVALENCSSLIGSNTYVMTLQNGSGHEDILSRFVRTSNIIIGTTEDNGVILGEAYVKHGKNGSTNIGMLQVDKRGTLISLKQNFEACGFQTKVHDDIKRLIWDKLMINVSLSALTGVLQVPIGFVAQNQHALALATKLIEEAILVAEATGMTFERQTVLDKMIATSNNSKDGYTSIYMDIKHGRKTEVDTISGAVVKAAQKIKMNVPCHEMMVQLIHALEDKV